MAWIGAVLLVPAIAMQLTSEVNWGPEDFLAAAALLFVATATVRTLRAHLTGRHRVIATLAVLGLAALVWAQLAVGLLD